MRFSLILRNKRIRVASFFLSLFVLLWLVQGTVESTAIRQNNQERLLFWSLFDFNIDAATQQIGPLDLFVRGDDEVENALQNQVEVEVEVEASSWISPTTTKLYPNVTDKPRGLSSNNSLLGMRGGARRKPSQLIYSLYQEGDGSENDPDKIPLRFLKMHNQDRDLAKKSLKDTLEWRRKQGIDDLLNQPHPKFDIAKRVFPHYFLDQRDTAGHIVFVQHPAKLDLDMAKANNLIDEDLLMHYVYVNEYLWQVLEGKSALATMTSIIDLHGLQLGILRRRDVMSFVKKFVSTMDSYYPQRAHKTLVLNCPKWFNTLYKIVSPLMRETTKSKIEIFTRGKAQDKALKSHLGKDAVKMLPDFFWSEWSPPKKQKKGRWGKRKRAQEEDEADAEDEVEQDHTVFVPPESKFEKELREFVSPARIRQIVLDSMYGF